MAVDPDQFISLVQPLLERKDLPGLLSLLNERWSPQQIQDLMANGNTDVKKVALLAVGLVGRKCCLKEVARHLKDPDPVVNEMAEHALWSVWFRIGRCPEANHQLARGVQAIERRDFEHAICHFNKALDLDPDFAEAYNQRALAHYLLDEYEEALSDCEETLKRIPFHFGALSGKGHCHLNLNQLDKAITAYQKALEVNPHLECIRQTVKELKMRCCE